MPLLTETIAAALKRETAQQHEMAEAALMPKLSDIQNREDYTALLKMFYGFFKPMQQRIAQYHLLDDLLQRRSSSWILDDLRSLGVEITGIPLAEDLPYLPDPAHAYGAMYVLEGSTLGGRIIRKMMMRSEPWPVPEESLSFFNGYGEKTGSMWKAFQDKLNEQPEATAIIDAANETFLLFRNWIEKSLYRKA